MQVESDNSSSPFSHLLADKYPAIKAQYPTEGRRKRRLRAAELFWGLSANDKAAYANSTSSARGSTDGFGKADFATDGDPYDAFSGNAPGLGVLVRTDYSDEEAWKAFCAKLQEGEAEFKAAAEEQDATDEPMEAGGDAPATEQAAGDEEMDQEDDDAEEEESSQIIFVVDAPSPSRAALMHISNLAALRLLNDVDVRRAPPRPADTPKAKAHRLVDQDGWQEVYVGKTVWVYDARSNVDQSVRLVSQQGGMYGTATGDSWRARVRHVCELQVNLSSGAMKIDFGGLDRWDYDERLRNLQEAVDTSI
ncbi:hypothetical protein BKA93DRAFT_830851 [Sparassis latifolia]